MNSKQFPLTPIEDRIQYDKTREIIRNMDGQKNLTEDEQIYLDRLFALVTQYEKQHFKCRRTFTPQERLLYKMEQWNLSLEDINSIAGCDLTEFLSGQSRLTEEAAIKLSERFAITPSAFLED